jgi:uncharacterized protein YbaR (Trm112 family)
MFIELTEYLACPEGHEEQNFLVLAQEKMDGRRVVRGSVGCPLCKREYGIERYVVRFGEPSGAREGEVPASAETVQALLGIAGPGGYVVLVGAAARLAEGLAAVIDGVHFVGVNAPGDVAPSESLSLVVHPSTIPLKSSMARGVVVGAEYAAAPWLAEAARLLLRGLRMVVLREGVSARGVAELASESGLWVGQKE